MLVSLISVLFLNNCRVERLITNRPILISAVFFFAKGRKLSKLGFDRLNSERIFASSSIGEKGLTR